MSMFLYSLTIVWYALHGNKHFEIPNRPWYSKKQQEKLLKNEAHFAEHTVPVI